MEPSGCWMNDNVASTPLTSSLVGFLPLLSAPPSLRLIAVSDALPQWTLQMFVGVASVTVPSVRVVIIISVPKACKDLLHGRKCVTTAFPNQRILV